MDTTESIKDSNLTPTLTNYMVTRMMNCFEKAEIDVCHGELKDLQLFMCIRQSGYRAINPKMMGFKVFFEKFKNINSLSIVTKGSYPGCSSRIRKEMARCLDPNTVFKNITDCQPETIVGIALHQNEDVNVYYLQGLCYVVEFKNLMSDLLKKAEAYQTSLVNSQDAQQLQDSSQIIYIGLDDAKDELSLLIKKYGQMVRLNYLDNVNDLIKQVMLAKFDTGNEVNQEVSLYIINSTKEIVMSEGSIKSIDELGITCIFINSHFNSLC